MIDNKGLVDAAEMLGSALGYAASVGRTVQVERPNESEPTHDEHVRMVCLRLAIDSMVCLRLAIDSGKFAFTADDEGVTERMLTCAAAFEQFVRHGRPIE